MSEWISHTKNRMRIEFDALAAKEMADTLQIVLYNSADEQMTVVHETSVTSMAMSDIAALMNDATQAEYITLMVDMLNYGAEAQKNFNYNVDKLANKDLTEEQQACATQTVVYGDAVDHSGFAGYSTTGLELENNIIMNLIFFKDAFGVDVSELTAKVTYTHHNKPAEVLEETIESSEFVNWGKKNGRERFKIDIDWLDIPDGDQLVTVKFYDQAGNELGEVSEYLKGVLGMWTEALPDAGLYPAMIKFMNSAYAFLH